MHSGQSASLQFEVAEADTSLVLGSGDLEVLATPRLLAWCEAATCEAISGSLEESQTSVGTRVSLEHLAASPVGERIEVQASVVSTDGRLVRFAVAANRVSDGRVLGTGEVTRVVVERDRFLARVSPPGR